MQYYKCENEGGLLLQVKMVYSVYVSLLPDL